MTKDQILALDPVALTIEAHRILGKTIEWHSGVDPERDVYCNWRCTLKDGGTWTWIYHDVEKPTAETLERLQVECYAWSWDAAAELFGHEAWPRDVEIKMSTAGVRVLADQAFVLCEEPDLALAITRTFVFAHHFPFLMDLMHKMTTGPSLLEGVRLFGSSKGG